jgi:hypothetical protein
VEADGRDNAALALAAAATPQADRNDGHRQHQIAHPDPGAVKLSNQPNSQSASSTIIRIVMGHTPVAEQSSLRTAMTTITGLQFHQTICPAEDELPYGNHRKV